MAHRQLKVTTQLDPTELARLLASPALPGEAARPNGGAELSEPETRATVQMRTDEILKLIEASGDLPIIEQPMMPARRARTPWLAVGCVLVTIGSIFAIAANWS